MKTVKISYKGVSFDVQVKRVNAYPNDVFKIEFANNAELTAIMESPVFIIEKSDRLAFLEVQNMDKRELLQSFAEGINEVYESI